MSHKEIYRYENPPIKEILWEIKVESGENWDWTIPGLFYSKIKEKYPKKRQVNLFEMQIKLPRDKIQAPLPIASNKSISKMMFLNDDENFFIQIVPNLISCNQIKPYTHWNDFKNEVLSIFEKYIDLVKVKSIKKMTLRYIDLINIPKIDFKFTDYFNYYIHFPDEIPEFDMTRVFINSILSFKDANGNLNLTLSSAPSKNDVYSFILDWEYFIEDFQGIQLSDISKWGDEAHEYIRKLFESLLTNKTKKLFGEKIYVTD
ncbi:MAG: TIGR04255 family protein [Candidatus Helarchaeota archaeon]